MPLLVYNLTAAPLILANGVSTTIPASSAGAGKRGLPWIASGNELQGRSGAEYTALQAQVDAGSVQYEWMDSQEYDLGVLVASATSQINAPQLLSGPGAVNLYTRTTRYTSTGAAEALTLANGIQIGQRKTVIHALDGGDGVLTPTTASGFTTVTFTNLWDWVELEWTALGWTIAGFTGAVIA